MTGEARVDQDPCGCVWDQNGRRYVSRCAEHTFGHLKRERTIMIDINRCRRALTRLKVGGIPLGTVRLEAIADAISRIQVDGWMALRGEYIGVKNYAAFGDQREDHKEGYGPRHGTTVFYIRRAGEGALGSDEIYLLECLRDFGFVLEGPPAAPYQQPPQLNLAQVLLALDEAEAKAAKMRLYLARAAVETHEGQVPA